MFYSFPIAPKRWNATIEIYKVVRSVVGVQWEMQHRWRDPLGWIPSPSRITKSSNQRSATSRLRESGHLLAPAASPFMENTGLTLKESGYPESLSMWSKALVMTWGRRKRHSKASLKIRPISIFLSSKEFWSILMGKVSPIEFYDIVIIGA